MFNTLVIYTFSYKASLEPVNREEGKEYINESELCSRIGVKKGPNSFNAASIAFNQCWSKFFYVDDNTKIKYNVVGVHVTKVEEYKFDFQINLGPSLASQLPNTIGELMSSWKSTNPDKNRNANPKER